MRLSRFSRFKSGAKRESGALPTGINPVVCDGPLSALPVDWSCEFFATAFDAVASLVAWRVIEFAGVLCEISGEAESVEVFRTYGSEFAGTN
jgi:hypothetical protein